MGRREHPCNALVDETACSISADGEPADVFGSPAGEPIQLPRFRVLRRRGIARMWVGERGVRLDDGDGPVTIAADEIAVAEWRPAGELAVLALATAARSRSRRC